VLTFADMAKLRNIAAYTDNKFHSAELDICYPLAWGKEGVEARLASLCAEAEDAVQNGSNILIVSDRKLDKSTSPSRRCWPPRRCISTW
jgi:glutamate synthase (NADPH/NADH) large chain